MKQAGALDDLKVLEYGDFISGPYCGKLLADMGAEVIKVEVPGRGDCSRMYGPFPENIPDPEKSGLFLYLNTNKLGITLNLESESGRTIFKNLLRQADILIENFSSKKIKELGLQYEELRKGNPRLTMTSISAFGQTGPYRDYEATDLIISSMSGYAYSTPVLPDIRGVPPLRAGGHQTEFQAGVAAAVATLCALFGCQKTGLGQHVDVSSLEAFTFMQELVVNFLTHAGTIGSRFSTRMTAPSDLLPCSDGEVFFHCVAEEQWESFKEMMGNPDWAEIELFKTGPSRAQYWDSLKPLISQWTSQRTQQEVYRIAQANRVPAAPVNTTADLLKSEHLTAREYWTTVDHPEVGKVTLPGAPYRLSVTPWMIRRPAPLLGQHNEEIYCGRLGFSHQDLVGMRQSGII
ncbi:CaiB/BaiF CoA transferase family protein [Chloroflexota bacterium]